MSFVAPFPEPNLALKLASRGVKMMGTHDSSFNDEKRVCQGVKKCLHAFIDMESQRCQTLKGKSVAAVPQDLLWLKPGGLKASLFWENDMSATFRAHFVVFWLGLYAAPEVKAMSKYWNDWHGMWDYRYRGSWFHEYHFYFWYLWVFMYCNVIWSHLLFLSAFIVVFRPCVMLK